MNKEILPKKELDNLVEKLGKEITNKCHEIGGGIVFVCIYKNDLGNPNFLCKLLKLFLLV